jgi:hypothetical protein
VSVATDKGVLRRHDGRLRVAAVPSGEGTLAERTQALVAACGYAVEVVRDVEVLAPLQHGEVIALREFDRQRLFLN